MLYVWSISSPCRLVGFWCGVSQFGIDDKEPGFAESVSPSGFYMNWVAGSEYLDSDLRYIFSQSASSQHLTLSVSGVSYFLRPKLPVNKAFTIYGLFGYSSLLIDRTVKGLFPESGSQLGLSYGAGATYRAYSDLDVGIEWVSYMKDVQIGAPGVDIRMSVSGLSALVLYHF